MRLFNAFSAGGYHTSLVSTFSLDFEAYEAIALPRLRDAGCSNNILVADARMLVQALADKARRPKSAGRRYSVVGAQCAGVFHPKLVLQLGTSSGRLLVMSANMTAAGLAGNFEVVGEVVATEAANGAAPLLRAAVDYFQLYLDPMSMVRRQVDWALKRTRWLPASTPADALVEIQDGMRLALLHNGHAKGIGERFIELVGKRTVKRLVVVSPYWDSDLRTLRALQQRTAAETVATVIQPKSALYPVHAHPVEGGFGLFSVDRVQGANASRFAHAKVVVVESDEGDCVLFGSGNCTEAALGSALLAGVNGEACLFRDFPAGEAVQLLGLEAAMNESAELAIADIPSFAMADEIPMRELEARLAGRFELSGDLLRWWPPTSLSPDSSVLELLDQQEEPIPGNVSRIGAQSAPAMYRIDGTVAPHFAKVRSGAFESSLAIVVVEQAIQETQRRPAGRDVENALDLLDDEDASEGLWLLEVIRQLTEAERQMRGPRGGAEQSPAAAKSTEAEPVDSQILSYEAFVAGRRSEDVATASASSHLATTHYESIRGFLNALIGKQAALDLAADSADETSVPNLGMGDETGDGAGALESDTFQQADVTPPSAEKEAEDKKRLRQRQRYVQDTQQSIVTGVNAFLKKLREQVAGGQSLSVIDLLRLRALLVVVIGAGSKKADLLPKDLTAQVHRRQVLPFAGESSWRRTTCRLLFDFFRDHGGSSGPLINALTIEADGGQVLPEDVLECWATCFWAICAIRVATNDKGVVVPPSNSETQLAWDIYRFTRLLPQEALGAVVQDVFDGMNRRYGERLGAQPDAVNREHSALVETARARAFDSRSASAAANKSRNGSGGFR